MNEVRPTLSKPMVAVKVECDDEVWTFYFYLLDFPFGDGSVSVFWCFMFCTWLVECVGHEIAYFSVDVKEKLAVFVYLVIWL